MYEPSVSVIYGAKMPKKIQFFKWRQARGGWRWGAFWPEANPFASSTNIGGQSEWVMLSHAVLTTTEVLLSEAFNPPPTCSGGSALWSAVGGGLYAAATRCECTEQILVDKRIFVQKTSPTFIFEKCNFFSLLQTRRTPSHSDFSTLNSLNYFTFILRFPSHLSKPLWRFFVIVTFSPLFKQIFFFVTVRLQRCILLFWIPIKCLLTRQPSSFATSHIKRISVSELKSLF